MKSNDSSDKLRSFFILARKKKCVSFLLVLVSFSIALIAVHYAQSDSKVAEVNNIVVTNISENSADNIAVNKPVVHYSDLFASQPLQDTVSKMIQDGQPVFIYLREKDCSMDELVRLLQLNITNGVVYEDSSEQPTTITLTVGYLVFIDKADQTQIVPQEIVFQAEAHESIRDTWANLNIENADEINNSKINHFYKNYDAIVSQIISDSFEEFVPSM